MKLYIAGINHNDPLCRIELIEWMKDLAKQEQTPPAYVAPEWKEEYFNLVKEQRVEFDKNVRSEWLLLTNDQHDAITLSLGYEGDAHIDVFGELPVVWLDQERNVPSSSVKDFYKYRLQNLIRWSEMGDENESFLKLLSKTIREEGNSDSAASNPSIDKGRNAAFYRAIKAACNPLCSNWAIIVVGAIHAQSTPESMISLLESDGYQCIVKNLSV